MNKPKLAQGNGGWLCTDGYAHGKGRSACDAYSSFKQQKALKAETRKMLAAMTADLKKQEDALFAKTRRRVDKKEEGTFPIQGVLTLVVIFIFCLLVF